MMFKERVKGRLEGFRKSEDFTLIELLVVIAIIGILAPMLKGIMTRQEGMPVRGITMVASFASISTDVRTPPPIIVMGRESVRGPLMWITRMRTSWAGNWMRNGVISPMVPAGAPGSGDTTATTGPPLILHLGLRTGKPDGAYTV